MAGLSISIKLETNISLIVFNILQPMSASTVYLESLQGEVIAFTPKVA